AGETRKLPKRKRERLEAASGATAPREPSAGVGDAARRDAVGLTGADERDETAADLLPQPGHLAGVGRALADTVLRAQVAGDRVGGRGPEMGRQRGSDTFRKLH